MYYVMQRLVDVHKRMFNTRTLRMRHPGISRGIMHSNKTN